MSATTAWVRWKDWHQHPVLRHLGATEDRDGAMCFYPSDAIAGLAHSIDIQGGRDLSIDPMKVADGTTSSAREADAPADDARWIDLERFSGSTLVRAGTVGCAWYADFEPHEQWDFRARVSGGSDAT